MVRFNIDRGQIKHSSGQVSLTLIKNDSSHPLRRLRIEKSRKINSWAPAVEPWQIDNRGASSWSPAGVQLVLDWLLIVHDVIVRQNNSILLNNWNIWSSTVNYDSEEKRMTCWIKLLFELVRVFEITIFVNYEPRTIQINSQKSTSKNNEFSQKLLRKNSAIRRNFNSGVHVQIYM